VLPGTSVFGEPRGGPPPLQYHPITAQSFLSPFLGWVSQANAPEPGSEPVRQTSSAQFAIAILPFLLGPEADIVAEGTVARTFASSDPLVADLANQIEAMYPGHVVGVNVPMIDAAGRVATDADILLKNAVIQVKSGAGKGLTTQLLNTQAVTHLPVIGYGPQLGGSLIRGIQANGGLVTRDLQLLIHVVAP
jgi:hypothetical protein